MLKLAVEAAGNGFLAYVQAAGIFGARALHIQTAVMPFRKRGEAWPPFFVSQGLHGTAGRASRIHAGPLVYLISCHFHA